MLHRAPARADTKSQFWHPRADTIPLFDSPRADKGKNLWPRMDKSLKMRPRAMTKNLKNTTIFPEWDLKSVGPPVTLSWRWPPGVYKCLRLLNGPEGRFYRYIISMMLGNISNVSCDHMHSGAYTQSFREFHDRHRDREFFYLSCAKAKTLSSPAHQKQKPVQHEIKRQKDACTSCEKWNSNWLLCYSIMEA